MSSLRTLGICYLASASAFVVAATLSAHPDLGRMMGRGTAGISAALQERVVVPVLDFAMAQDRAFLDTPSKAHRELRLPDSFPRAEIALAPLDDGGTNAAPPKVLGAPQFAARAQELILPDLTPLSQPTLPDVAAPQAPRASAPDFAVAQAAPPPLPPATPSELRGAARLAEARLKAGLTPEMLRHFGLFLYVSKAERGPVAQRMYVFKNEVGALKLAYDWPASTGREKAEISPLGRHTVTNTPRGYYELDPARMYAHYHSTSWDQDMPHSMFFNWERQGLQTGLAIHAAVGDDIARLGMRASAGCVHLSPENAATLYNLIRADYRGPVPRFAYDRRIQTMSKDGTLAHDRNGHLKMADGYQVMIYIENYGGGDVVAALF